jgi:iron complex outermembrane recepter protein
MKKMSLLLLMQLLLLTGIAQTGIKGIVTDHNKQPLPGASVVIKQTYNGISTGHDGSYEFKNLKAGNHVLMVSFIGFETREVDFNPAEISVLNVELTPKVVFTEEIMVAATRAGDKTPVAYTNISGEFLKERNFGQDIPYLLTLTPSFVATSDAGAGIGYTNFRVRGTDLNRINVTVNGIPLNDAESHGTWFVDQPDLAGSTENIQIQRGVGTSTNGAAAFGATINLQTLSLIPEPYTEFRTAAGSFSTFRNTLSAGTGLINGKFTVDARLSKIASDGFIDRAFSDLKSFYLAAGYYAANTVVKVMVSGGLETTYQAWNGVPSVRLNSDTEGMKRYEDHWLYSAAETSRMLASHPRTYNLYTYENQVDNYQQDHFQVHLSHRLSNYVSFNAALHYTIGLGYYEQFKANQKFTDYGMNNPVINGLEVKRTDLVRRKILDNDFYGGIFSLNYKKGKTDLWWGGGVHQYDGLHYGNIIWAAQAGGYPKDYEWYHNKGVKTDMNSYLKVNYQLTRLISLFGDAQIRHINYEMKGIDDDLRSLSQKHLFTFFNPKAGIFVQPSARQHAYFSFARASREPNRDNFADADQSKPQPRHETLNDFELGYQIKNNAWTAGVNFYYMHYNHQLALTGQINDVGSPIMVNVDKSYRTGMELNWGVKILPSLQWDANATFSKNKIKDFTEYIDDWDTGGQQAKALGTTDLAFSPNTTGNSQLRWSPFLNTGISLVSHYAGKQYIDNTSSDDRVLEAWMVNSLIADYKFSTELFDQVTLRLMVNNLFDTEYESNAWVYSYLLDGQRYKMDGYFPQAGIHFMFGIDIRF